MAVRQQTRPEPAGVGDLAVSLLGCSIPLYRVTLDALAELAPENIDVEFGVKLAGQAGAIIAETTAEGHFTVKMSWSRASGTVSVGVDHDASMMGFVGVDAGP
jgi:hypothetical protein